MRGDIQFEKIDVKKSRIKKVLAVFAYLLLVVTVFVSVLSVRAYFTATATRSGEISFGSIEISLLDSGSTEITSAEFKEQYIKDLMPGSTINFDDITVKNIGTSDAYVLLNLDITIPASDSIYDLHYNLWYDVASNEVNTNEFVLNTVEPTKIVSNASETTNIEWTVPGDIVDNKYATKTATVNLTAYACQTYLPYGETYATNQGGDVDLYATYFIISNAPFVAKNTGTTYSGKLPYSLPVGSVADSYNSTDQTVTRNIKKIVLTGEEEWSVYPGYPPEDEGISYRLGLSDKEIGFQTSFCSHFENVNGAWRKLGETGIYSDHGTSTAKYMYFKAPNDSVKAKETEEDNFSSALEAFKVWLKAEYNAGTPVTLWYQTTTPTTEKIYSTKNLFSGSANLTFKTDGTANTTTEKGLCSITDVDLLKYLKNKEFTVSALIKYYEEDTSKISSNNLGYKITIEYVYSSGNSSTSASYSVQQSIYNENWNHNWLTNKEILSSISASNFDAVTAINIYLSDYDSVGSVRNFEIKNIQIELGEVPTQF